MQWVAYYEEGNWLRQYDDDGTEHSYRDIDRNRVTSFALYDGPPATRKILHLHLLEGQRLIYRRRVELPSNTVVYLVGWQKTINGENVQSIAYVFPEGEVIMAGKWNEQDRWMYSIEEFGFEKDGLHPQHQ